MPQDISNRSVRMNSIWSVEVIWRRLFVLTIDHAFPRQAVPMTSCSTAMPIYGGKEGVVCRSDGDSCISHTVDIMQCTELSQIRISHLFSCNIISV